MNTQTGLSWTWSETLKARLDFLCRGSNKGNKCILGKEKGKLGLNNNSKRNQPNGRDVEGGHVIYCLVLSFDGS